MGIFLLDAETPRVVLGLLSAASRWGEGMRQMCKEMLSQEPEGSWDPAYLQQDPRGLHPK